MNQSVDAQVLNQTFDLLSLVESDTTLRREGAWYIGPCPLCPDHGTDRFNLKQTPDGWKWFCRHCGEGKYHGAIDYIMRRQGIEFLTALQFMTGKASAPEKPKATPPETDLVTEPPLAWRVRAAAYVEECRQSLWKPEGAKALAWLQNERGLKDWAIAKYRLGYNPADRYESLESWGVDGDSGQVWLARGVTFPAAGPLGIYYVKTRRALPAGSKDKKYVKVRGSRPGVFGWNNMRGAWLAVVTEGEIDCITLDQEAGDLAAVCTFGSITDSPLHVAPDLLRWYPAAAHTLIAFDSDEQGCTGALSFQEKLPRVRVVSLPEGVKDINDFYGLGGDLADWLCRQVEALGIELSLPGANIYAGALP